MEMIERVAQAMEDRRRELIGQPLARIWDKLAKAAIEAIKTTREEFGSFCNGRQQDGVANWEVEEWTDECFALFFDTALQEGKETAE